MISISANDDFYQESDSTCLDAGGKRSYSAGERVG